MKIGKRLSTVFCYAIALAFAFLAIFLLVWMVLSSFKPSTQIYTVPIRLLPETWTTSNYAKVFSNTYTNFLRSLMVTFIVAVAGTFLALSATSMAGYVFARIRFVGKKFLWPYCLISMYVPGLTIFITQYLVVNSMNMVDTMWGLIIPGAIGGYAIFFFRQFFLNIPSSLEDAARIDGCGRFRIYWQIFLPVSKAPIVVMGAGNFLGYWNSFIWPAVIITKPEYMQIMQIIRTFSTSYGNDYGAIMAATTISVIIPIVMFCIFQRYIVQGFVLSGIK